MAASPGAGRANAQQAALAAQFQQAQSAIAPRQGARAELVGRMRAAELAGRRSNAIVMLVLSAVFALVGLACFAGAVGGVASVGQVDARVFGIAGFGLFWFALSALLSYIGLRYHRSIARERRLRAAGIHGLAAILEYEDTKLRVDGKSRVHLSLRVTTPDRSPWEVRITENVPRVGLVSPGAVLPVLINPADPRDVLVDWWAL